ncbi:MAG TPA: MOSC domain-containing protein [Bacteroidetes bacterium]|nr:MOSC domain-containing protein [Bacteroidota bacterium]
MEISHIFIYPIKGLGGISLQEADLTERGLAHDRRWMVVNGKDQFLSQRKYPQMALLRPTIKDGQIRIDDLRGGREPLLLPLELVSDREAYVSIWKNKVHALKADGPANRWISQALGTSASFVFMPKNSHRIVDPLFVPELDLVSFADAFPHLLISQASLDDLNSRLEKPVPMNRFRPNFVVTGADPYAELTWAEFTIGKVTFMGRKPCYRCAVTIIDQDTGIKGHEPLQTMNGYLKVNHKILFGENLIHDSDGKVSIGDAVEILKTKPSPLLTE